MKKFVLQITFDSSLQDLILKTREYCLCYSDRNDVFGNRKLTNSLFVEFQGNSLYVKKPKSKVEKVAKAVAILALQNIFEIPVFFSDDDNAEKSSIDQLYSEYINVGLPDNTDKELHFLLYMSPCNSSDNDNVRKLIDSIPNHLAGRVFVDVILMPVCLEDGISDDDKASVKSNLQSLVELKARHAGLFNNIFYSETIDESGTTHKYRLRELSEIFGKLALAHINSYDSLLLVEDAEYPLTAYGLCSVQIDRFEIINNWLNRFLGDEITPVFNAKDPHQPIDKAKVHQILRQILNEERTLIDSVPDSDNIPENVFNGFKEKVLSLITDSNLNTDEIRYILDNCLNLSKREIDSLEDVDFSEILLPDELFSHMLSDFGGDDKYARLHDVIEQIHNLKSAIAKRQSIIEDLRGKLDENYPYDGELTDEGFKIHGELFKPYTHLEEPLDSDYTPPVDKPESNADLRKYFSEIKNQGQQGACSAFSMVSVFEYLMSTGSINQDLSEAFVYYNAREIPGDTDKDKGVALQYIVKAMAEKGVCVEELWPYRVNNYTDKPNEVAYKDGVKRKISAAQNVPIDIEVIKSAINEGYPVIAAFRVFDSFAKNVRGFVPLPTEEEMAKEKKEYHAMVLCGYSDEQSYFIVRNSWGKQFGDNGYCYIPYAYVRNPELVIYACTVTGIDVNTSKHSADRFNYCIDDKDNNIQFTVLNNQLFEEQLHLNTDKNQLQQLYKEYRELLEGIKEERALGNLQVETDRTIIEKRTAIQKLKEDLERENVPIRKKIWGIVHGIASAFSVSLLSFGLFRQYKLNDSYTLTIIGGVLTLACAAWWVLHIIKTRKRKRVCDELQTQIDALDKEVADMQKQLQNKLILQRKVAFILKNIDGISDNAIDRKRILMLIEAVLSDVRNLLSNHGDDYLNLDEFEDIYYRLTDRLKGHSGILKSLLKDGFDKERIIDALFSIQNDILQQFNDRFDLKIEDYYSMEPRDGEAFDNWNAFCINVTNTATNVLAQVVSLGQEPNWAVFFSNIQNPGFNGCQPVFGNNNQYLYLYLRRISIDKNMKLYSIG